MAAATQQEKPSAEVIGQAFAEQYYAVLHQSPAVVYRFYQDISKLGRPEDGTNMALTTGMEAINAKIQSYGTLKAEIRSIDAQESYNGGVVVLITGHMVQEDEKRKSFTQTFFLAPQEVGYFVLNDIFRYVEDGHSHGENENLANGVASLNISEQETSPVQHNEIVNQPEEFIGGEVCDPSEDGEGSVVEQEEPEPIAEIVNEAPPELEAVVECENKTEDAPKKTYASIVKVRRESGTHIPGPASLKLTPKVVQQPQQMSTPPPPASVSENSISSSNVAEDGSNQEGEVEGLSIYVKNLPVNATPAMLEEAFKKFGPIKSGGIQVRSNKGFCFGFVEFEVPDPAQNAIEAGSILIGGRQVAIEEKKSTSSRGSSRGRFPQGRGGFRNEGPPRGRGSNYGRGRGYVRGEFGRSDFGNRGNGRGFQNRNPDGYEKGDMGNRGARFSRGGGPTSNVMDKTQRVPATA